MKPTLVLFTVLLATSNFASAWSTTTKAAILTLPDVLPVRCSLTEIEANVKIHWQDDQPVTIDVWSVDGREIVSAKLSIYDETDKEVPVWVILSSYQAPYNARRKISKGDVVSLGLHLDGVAEFKRPGRYYAIATFYSALSEANVTEFKTQKCWFRVEDHGRGPPNKSPEPTPASVTPAASAPGAPPTSAAQL
jgi:hypothetical protein